MHMPVIFGTKIVNNIIWLKNPKSQFAPPELARRLPYREIKAKRFSGRTSVGGDHEGAESHHRDNLDYVK